MLVGDYKPHADGPVLVVRAVVAKSDRDEVIPLHPTAEATVARFAAAKAPGDPLFGVPGSNMSLLFRQDLARAGIPRRTEAGVANVHCLRTSYITALALAGVPMPVVQKLARHASLATTARYYVRLGLLDLRVGLDRVDWSGST
jgi:integrase